MEQYHKVREEYPNIEACADGRTSGQINDWTRLKMECQTVIEEITLLRNLLTRIHHWDHMDTASDGTYWRTEINRVVAGIEAPSPTANR